jgi:hypothetical protein
LVPFFIIFLLLFIVWFWAVLGKLYLQTGEPEVMERRRIKIQQKPTMTCAPANIDPLAAR